MRKFRRLAAIAGKVSVAALAVLTLSTLPAVDDTAKVVGTEVEPAAAGSPIAYRQAGNHWSPMLPAPNADPQPGMWLAPGEPFYMKCWFDFKDATGLKNYPTKRWFWGISKNHGSGYIHASFIYYQIRVPHC